MSISTFNFQGFEETFCHSIIITISYTTITGETPNIFQQLTETFTGVLTALIRIMYLSRAQKQPKRGRLWLTDGSVIRLKSEFPKHVWSYDFTHDRTHNGVAYRILNSIDEYTRECLAVKVARSLTHKDGLELLTDLFLERGVPVHIRPDNGSEFTAKKVRTYLSDLQIKPLFIESGSPWENGYIESFNGKMRNELLAGEIFYSITEAQIIIEQWRWHYNQIRPYSALGYKPPAPVAFINHSSQL